ncbi:MAG: hypothetical protein AAFR81_00810 [Chloroflexota bacterium]
MMSLNKLTIQRTTTLLVFMMLFAIALRVPTDTDTWWHLRSGDYTLSNGMISGDPFSHTQAGEEWINHSWGAQLIMIGVWRVAGNAGLALYTAVFAVGGMALLYNVMVGNTYVRAFTAILGALTAAIFWSARPQIISFFFLCLILWLLLRYKRDNADYLWAIVPIMWLWSNLHAGWAIGYLFLFAFLVGEAFNNVLGVKNNIISWAGWRKLLIFSTVSIPFLALSPYGIDNMLVPFATVNIEPLRAFIQEWQSPNFQNRGTWAFIAMILVLFLAFWNSRLPFDWSHFFLLSGALFLALLYSRNISVFAVAATPLLTYHVDNILTEREWQLRPRERVPRTMALLNVTIIVVVVLGIGLYAVGLLLPTNVQIAQAEALPVDAVAYMNENELPSELFNDYNWGGYLIFAAPDYPVFVDGRTDLYGDFVNTYNRMQLSIGDSATLALLQQYDIRLVLMPVGAPLTILLQDTAGWQLEYEDEVASLWVMEGTSNDE